MFVTGNAVASDTTVRRRLSLDTEQNSVVYPPLASFGSIPDTEPEVLETEIEMLTSIVRAPSYTRTVPPATVGVTQFQPGEQAHYKW